MLVLIRQLKIKNYLSCLLLLLIASFVTQAQVYRTSWDNASERQGWKQYHLGLDSNSSWSYTPVAILTGEVLIHAAPPISNVNVTDNWIVSPVFNFSAGGSIDSLIVNLSGVEVPSANDRLGIYLVKGSQNPSVSGSWQLLKQFDSTDYMLNAGTYQNMDSIIIPPTSGNSYIAFRYKTINTQFDAVFDALQVTANYPNAIRDFDLQKGYLKIYPNPTSDAFSIKFDNITQGQKLNIKIFNSFGQLVYSKANHTNNHLTLDISVLPIGMYSVSVRWAGQHIYKSFLKK
jgi:hypothetical protein